MCEHRRAVQRLWIAPAICAAIILLLALPVTAAPLRQSETETPTPTATPTETPTPTITPTPTPDVVIYSTLDPSGQAVAVRMEVTAGDIFLGSMAVAQVLVLGILALLLLKQREP